MRNVIRAICGRLEHLSVNHVSWLRTIYFNFRVLPFHQARHLPFYIYGTPAFNNLSGNVEVLCRVRRGMFRVNVQKEFAPSLQTLDTQIVLCGTLLLRGEVSIGCGNKIIVNGGAVLDIGEKVMITDFCNIDCCRRIEIKQGACISHRSQIMDSNHHFVYNENEKSVRNNMKPIVVGRNCWICNSATILAGSKIPDYCIVGSNSLVNKDFSSSGTDNLIAGIPAKVVAKGIFRVFDTESEYMLIKYFAENADDEYEVTGDAIALQFRNLPTVL